MRRGIAFFLILLLLIPLAFADEYIVIKRGKTGKQQGIQTALDTAAAEHGLKVTHQYRTIPGMAVEATPEEIANLKEDPSLTIIPNTRRSLFLGQSVPLIQAPAAHRRQVNGTNLTGAGESICIIDTGIDYNHTAFAGKIIASYDFVNNDDMAEDDDGHGTHVAGIAAGNSTVSGVAPGASLVIVKVCDATGCWDSDIVAGIDFCNTQAAALNISVISASLGSEATYNATTCVSDPSYGLFEPVLQESLDRGIIPVFAAGNNGDQSGISYPGCSPRALTVGSTSKTDAISPFSNRGDRLDIYAPGEGITSTKLNGTVITMSGTSMATPHVAGALAILMQLEHASGMSLNLTQARSVLRETGKPVGSTSRIDIDSAAFLLSTRLLMDRSTGGLTNSTGGSAVILNASIGTGTDVGSCVILQQNLVGVHSDTCPQYNVSAQITITGLRSAAVPLRNGVPCPSEICTAANYTNGTLRFNVTGFSNYSALELTPVAVTIMAPATAIKGRPFAMAINITNNGTEAAQDVTFQLSFAGTTINASHPATGGRFLIGDIVVNETVLLNLTLNLSTGLANGTATLLLTNTTYRTTVETEILLLSNASITVIGAPNLTLRIIDTPDPATVRTVYVLNITNLGDEAAYDAALAIRLSDGMALANVTVQEGTTTSDNRSFLLGNITPTQSVILWIESNLSGSGPWNLSAQLNHTYEGEEQALGATETTALATPRRSSGGGGGGGGGAAPTKTFFLNESGEFTLYRNDRITFKTGGSQYSIILLDTNGTSIAVRVGSEEIVLEHAESAGVDVTGDELDDIKITLLGSTRLSARVDAAAVAAPAVMPVQQQGIEEPSSDEAATLELPNDIPEPAAADARTITAAAAPTPARRMASHWVGLLIATAILTGIVGAVFFARQKN